MVEEAERKEKIRPVIVREPRFICHVRFQRVSEVNLGSSLDWLDQELHAIKYFRKDSEGDLDRSNK